MDEGSSQNMPTNKEIIDELTKNVKYCCMKIERDNEPSNDERITLFENPDKEDNESEPDKSENESSTNIDPFNVDEEEIKSRDITLTETEKEAFKNNAEKLKLQGNTLFKEEMYEEATKTYTSALRILPLEYQKERAILYANRAAAKTKFMLEREMAIIDCTKAIELDPYYVKAYLRRAHLYEETDKLDEALEDFKKVLTFDPSHTDSNCAVRRLPPIIEERNEKLKMEMFGKLKDLGNMILRPFGLSTNNFELNKNSDSGGYSVQFKQNPS